MKVSVIGMLIVVILLTTGCYNHKEDLLYPQSACSGVDAKYTANVEPLIQSRCGKESCHNATSTNSGGPFTNYDEIKSKAALIKNAVTTGFMPQDFPLTSGQIKIITCWVDSGAPKN